MDTTPHFHVTIPKVESKVLKGRNSRKHTTGSRKKVSSPCGRSFGADENVFTSPFVSGDEDISKLASVMIFPNASIPQSENTIEHVVENIVDERVSNEGIVLDMLPSEPDMPAEHLINSQTAENLDVPMEEMMTVPECMLVIKVSDRIVLIIQHLLYENIGISK